MMMEEILAGESKNVEFKERLPGKSIQYMKSVVAFANGSWRQDHFRDRRQDQRGCGF